MRIKGRPVEISPGVWSEWPPTREQALLEDTLFYRTLDPSPCPKCGDPHVKLIYTRTNIRNCCAMKETNEVYVTSKMYGEPLNAFQAQQMGFDFYVTTEKGFFCGHPGVKTLQGKCYICENDRNRKKAKLKGELWYWPENPEESCKNNHHSLKRVSDRACKQCLDGVKTPSSAIQDIAPNMIISRDDAIAAGFKVYRTGEPCRRGHIGWRYTANKGCIECMAGGNKNETVY